MAFISMVPMVSVSGMFDMYIWYGIYVWSVCMHVWYVYTYGVYICMHCICVWNLHIYLDMYIN